MYSSFIPDQNRTYVYMRERKRGNKKKVTRYTAHPLTHYRYAYELVQRQGVCIDATVMTSCSLDAEFDFCCGPRSPHWSMGPSPCAGANPFSPNAKGPGPPEVTVAANSMLMLSIGASPAPPSGPFPFSNSNCGVKEDMQKRRWEDVGSIIIWYL